MFKIEKKEKKENSEIEKKVIKEQNFQQYFLKYRQKLKEIEFWGIWLILGIRDFIIKLGQ